MADGTTGMGWLEGCCHCGAVRFEASVDPAMGFHCNCTVCTKVAPTVGIVMPDRFVLVAGEGELSEYVFGRKTLRRYFCRRCGVHVFARGQVAAGGAFVAVNLNTLEGVDVGALPVVHLDGRHDHFDAPRGYPWPIFAAGERPLPRGRGAYDAVERAPR